ncbi:antitoxin family protein [Pyrofollis japonicus]|uniref:antitoxin family protein n=1 Tax=Pyrofollis japonicus TaxID=3060460 RepID=UPI00295B2AFA|nr:antitoxin family protein [Pyrofollis japonicus]BEP17250.1 antitoxin family protein [Pyrofollis japonicus]
MSRVIEAVYEKGVLKPLGKIELKDGERVKIIVLTNRDFYDLVEKLELEAKEDIDKTMAEIRERSREST